MHNNEIPTLTFSSNSLEDPYNGKFVCYEQNIEYLWNTRGFPK